jgi:very-short-patch-repair endonuclease
VNGEDGHRRLNVLFTRAREQLTVFSSMKSGDIRIDANSSLGVRALRDYIEYAGNGGRLLNNRPSRGRAGYDSPFEESVAALLKAEGFDCEPQVGVQGFFIDLGVRHHRHPSGFVCGVECDGAAYHSTRSARDRDRIRQNVLEGLGWKIVRVWSTDWFHNPGQARAKLIRQVHEALETATASSR